MQRLRQRFLRALHVGLDDQRQRLAPRPRPSASNMFSSLAACCLASLTSRNLPWRNSAISRALRSSPSTMHVVAGAAALRTGPGSRPESTGRPRRSACRSRRASRARGRRPRRRARRRRASACRTAPARSRPGRGPCRAALRSPGPWPARRSAPSAPALRPAAAPARAARRCPAPVLADTGTNGDSPPYSSGTTLVRPRSSCLTRSGLASGLSILLIATTIGTLAALAWCDRFLGLRHHAVVGRDHQDHDVGGLARRARASR